MLQTRHNTFYAVDIPRVFTLPRQYQVGHVYLYALHVTHTYINVQHIP